MPAPAETSVLVLGARGGIGREISALATGRGMRVHGADRDEIDLRDAASVAPYIERLWAEHGPFDGVVYAAGLFPAAPILETPATVFDDVFAVNTRAALEVGAAAARCAVAAARPLSLVYLSSPAGNRARPGTAVYAASKAALDALVRGFALEGAGRGIRCNAVAPGYTEVGSDINPIPDSYAREVARASPAGRVGVPADIAPVVLWLLGGESAWITGQTLVADGGASLGSPTMPSWLEPG
ncbi:SDR family NAD(P)-dependent oxidoreductase [Pseudonocardia sichuanensis]|uniref:SDR family NAD(P)-dependent oxidoreductase n=1 Tax=Pseudonocardia kunmingensis TaxID=630975 RepID=UPI001B867295|nr:SDR family oxidoreductase [Pseudonocardia kunmingensis]